MNDAHLSALRNDITAAVEEAISSDGIINVPAIAEKLRCLHDDLNIALEDVEALVLDSASAHQLPVLFDSKLNGAQPGHNKARHQVGGRLLC